MVITLAALAVMSGSAFAESGADFTSVAGKTCRGYYDQKTGGTGTLARPLSGFKFTPNKDGRFAYAAKATEEARDNWKTASGNSYYMQRETGFTVLPNGDWSFENIMTHATYALTRTNAKAGDPPGSVSFKVIYKDGNATAAGEAICQ